MRQTMMRALLSLGLMGVLAPCAVQADEARRLGPDHGPGQGAMHHPSMKGAEGRFHELMEPLWHSAPGPERTTRACAQATEIGARVQAMARERGPVTVLGRMTETARLLAPACANAEAGKVDQALDILHRQFHELMGMRN